MTEPLPEGDYWVSLESISTSLKGWPMGQGVIVEGPEKGRSIKFPLGVEHKIFKVRVTLKPALTPNEKGEFALLPAIRRVE